MPVGQDLLAEAEDEALGSGGRLSRQQRDQARRAAESLAEPLRSAVMVGDLVANTWAPVPRPSGHLCA